MNEVQGVLKEYTETIKRMEEEQAKVTAEYDALTKELAACKEEYDSYERKDIQYHENMKAQKSNLKKLRSKERENRESAEAKTKSVETMEQTLTQLEKDVVTLQEKKEAAEAALKAMLNRFKEEINGLKAKKKEIEVRSGVAWCCVDDAGAAAGALCRAGLVAPGEAHGAGSDRDEANEVREGVQGAADAVGEPASSGRHASTG